MADDRVITKSGRSVSSDSGQVEFDRNNFGPPGETGLHLGG